MRTVWLSIVLSSTAYVGGCFVPFPHVKKTCGPIEGTVVQAKTNTPISNAAVNVCYPDGGQRSTSTNKEGRFRFPAKHRFHWGFIFGVALNYSLPYDLNWFDFSSITIAAHGYRPVRFGPSKDHLHSHLLRLSDDRPQPFAIIQPEAVCEGEHDGMGSSRTWRYPQIGLQRAGPASQRPAPMAGTPE